jgi:hypothetical protein
MLSYKTPASIKADNAKADEIMARHNGKPSPEKAALERKDFKAALEARKRG